MVLAELRQLAAELNIPDIAAMRKGELIAAIKERQGGRVPRESDGGAAGQLQLPDSTTDETTDEPRPAADTSVSPESAVAVPAPADTASASPDAVPEPADMTPKPTGTVPESTDTASKPADTAPESTDTASKPTGTVPESTDTAPERTDTASQSTDTAPKRTDTASQSTDTAPKPADTAPESTDTAPEPIRNDLSDPAGPGVVEPSSANVNRAGDGVDVAAGTVESAPIEAVVAEAPVRPLRRRRAASRAAGAPDQHPTVGSQAGAGDLHPAAGIPIHDDQRRDAGDQDPGEQYAESRFVSREPRESRDSGSSRDVAGSRPPSQRNGRSNEGRDSRISDSRISDSRISDSRISDSRVTDSRVTDSQNNNNDGGSEDDDDGGRGRRGRRFRDRNRRGRDRREGTTNSGSTELEVRDDDVLLPVAGILDVLDNYAFVRTSGYLSGPNDVYVSLSMVRRYGLRRGDAVTGVVRQPRDGEQQRQKFNPLVRVDSINGLDLEQAKDRPEFTKLTPLYPNERMRLETEPHKLTTRVIDLVMPVGKGQRALIVSPPKAGKTMVLQAIANAITTNNPECHLMVVLVDERPEEVTDMQRSVKGEVIASTFDRPPTDHTTVAELSIERAKRLVEMGHDVVVLLDSITRLGRAYNLAAPASGRILSGGVDSTALYPPKRFLGAARNIEDGGSLTIFATALVETGSTMDTVIFEEFKGTGNAELKLDRKLADKRTFPAVDIDASSTRKEELLLAPDEMAVMVKLRRVLSALDSQQALDLVLTQLRKTRTNIEFLMQVAKSTPGSDD
ncbi:MAG: transcription termination factor Rho [Pseudonocardia sp.]|nr:transcription termination factor Rho [Pseudonocardia sp.]